MRIRNIKLYCLLCILCFSACQSDKSDSAISKEPPFVYTIDLSAKSVDFLDQIKSISVFGFEETQESLLVISSFFFEHEEGIIVVNQSSGDVFIFDQEGSFVNKFNRKGGGPEEYDEMAYTGYREGYIETYNYSKQRLARYDLEGKYLGETKLPHRAKNVFFDKGRYLLGMGSSLSSDSANYNLKFVDLEGNEYGETLPFDKEIPFAIGSSINAFRELNGDVLFNELLSDSIVLVGESDVSPYIQFDFGDEWFWTEDMYSNGSKSMGLINGADKVWMYNWVIGTDRIELIYNTSFSDYRRGFIDRSNGEFVHYDYPSWGEEIPSIRNVRFEGDELIITILPDVLDVIVERLGQAKYSVESGQTMEEILQSENPVVVKVKFK